MYISNLSPCLILSRLFGKSCLQTLPNTPFSSKSWFFPLLLRAGRTSPAWNLLQSLKKKYNKSMAFTYTVTELIKTEGLLLQWCWKVICKELVCLTKKKQCTSDIWSLKHPILNAQQRGPWQLVTCVSSNLFFMFHYMRFSYKGPWKVDMYSREQGTQGTTIVLPWLLLRWEQIKGSFHGGLLTIVTVD